jgi:nicotinamide phosphoribosyltransferase
MSIENVDPNCFWATNLVETLLMETWYPITIATQSRWIREEILKLLELTGTPESIDFKCHDFAYRGVSCPEQAAIGAAAHLLSFMGTDTVAGIELLQQYYNTNKMVGYSIPATEHSIICSFGKKNEVGSYRHLLDEYPNGVIACVSDTYDIYNACQNIWGGILRDRVIQRDGCLVIRPDSGDFLEVVPKVLDILADRFGSSINSKGYKVLDPHVRVIQGDGMNPQTIIQLYKHIISLGWSADNLAVGSGGGLLQKVNRDCLKMAIKASWVVVDGVLNTDVSKDPVTDHGKKSKAGKLTLVYSEAEGYKTVNEGTILTDDHFPMLFEVFNTGKLIKEYNYDELIANINK